MSMATAFSVALVAWKGESSRWSRHQWWSTTHRPGGFGRYGSLRGADRCKAAVTNSGHHWPSTLLTINLESGNPAKRGGHYDLAIVAAVLAADGVFEVGELAGTVLLGELGLDGRVRPVRGVLPATLAATSAGFRRVIVPWPGGRSWLVEGIEVFGRPRQLVALFRGDPLPAANPSTPPASRARLRPPSHWIWPM